MDKKIKVKIRMADQKDLAGILKVLYQLSPLKSGEKRTSNLRGIMKKMLKDKNYLLVVAEIGDKIVGTALLLSQMNLSHGGRPYGHIENVVTDQDCRGLGIGKKMMEHLLEKAKKADCYKVILNCEKYNVPFYEKCGFRETGEVEMRMN